MMLVSSSTLKRAPRIADFTSLVKGCDLLVIPARPQTLATDALLLTQRLSRPKQLQKYRVLLTIVPPSPEADGPELRTALGRKNYPVFSSDIAGADRSTTAISPGPKPSADRLFDALERWCSAASRGVQPASSQTPIPDFVAGAAGKAAGGRAMSN